MAAIPTSQVTPEYTNGDALCVGLFAVRKVTTGDTLDMAGWFSKITFAAAVGATASGTGNPTIAGTVLTFATVGLVSDALWLFVMGGRA